MLRLVAVREGGAETSDGSRRKPRQKPKNDTPRAAFNPGQHRVNTLEPRRKTEMIRVEAPQASVSVWRSPEMDPPGSGV